MCYRILSFRDVPHRTRADTKFRRRMHRFLAWHRNGETSCAPSGWVRTTFECHVWIAPDWQEVFLRRCGVVEATCRRSKSTQREICRRPTRTHRGARYAWCLIVAGRTRKLVAAMRQLPQHSMDGFVDHITGVVECASRRPPSSVGQQHETSRPVGLRGTAGFLVNGGGTDRIGFSDWSVLGRFVIPNIVHCSLNAEPCLNRHLPAHHATSRLELDPSYLQPDPLRAT